MKAASYRRRAILNRIHNALDAFYLLQRIDWEYDIRTTIDKVLTLALEEIELGEGRQIERALLIIQGAEVGTLEVRAGWRTEDLDLSFSRTVVNQAVGDGVPILCENAKDDPRFLDAESLKELTTLSLICVPIRIPDRIIGALYIESHSASNIFGEDDLEFLQEFAQAIGPYLKVALVHQGHVQEIQKLRTEIGSRHGLDNIVGRSEAMRGVFELIRLAASVDRTVLLSGDSGSGKELIARAVHYTSPRKHRPLITVDCSGLAEHLLESELFGHVKGAFTGASADNTGAFEEADGGTIFLDEISDAPRSLQQKLRRVLQEGEIRRVGENQFRNVDVRVICATNKSLPELVERGEFIRDLFYRINKLPIHLPPLRGRREDIPLLVQHFARAACEAEDRPAPAITVEAMELLARLEYVDNNVRELRNVVELAIDLCPGSTLGLDSLERALRIQRGDPLAQLPATGRHSLDEGSNEATGDEAPLVWIDRDAFLGLLERSPTNGGRASANGDTDGRHDKRSTPFYLAQREFAARVIIEGLRASDWKLRPAARTLGISPMKLRGELREYLAETLRRHGDDTAGAARDLGIPVEVLQKKTEDLGIELDGDERAPAPGSDAPCA